MLRSYSNYLSNLKKGYQMDQHSMRKKRYLLYIFFSGLLLNSIFATPSEVDAGELLQIAQSGEAEDNDEDDDEDC